MNKLIVGLFFISQLAWGQPIEAEPSSACMYCRRMDNNSGFLVSYSYCETSDECLKDAWNYINRDCQSGWQGGKNYELETCNPSDISCPDTFVSSEALYGSYLN